MSTVPIDNKVAALLRAGQGAFAAAEPNTGEGIQGEWPPAGDQDLFILSIHEKEGVFKDAARNVPCAEVQFEFEWIRNPADPTWDKQKDPGPLVFKGERFQLVPDPEANLQEKGSKTRGRMSWDRFRGHVQKSLGLTKEDCVDVMARYTQLKGLVAGPTRVAVSAKIEYREWESPAKPAVGNFPARPAKKGLNKTEYITGNITG